MNATAKGCCNRCCETRAACLTTMQWCLNRGGKLADAKLCMTLVECAQLCQICADACCTGSERCLLAAAACAKACDDSARACDAMCEPTLSACSRGLRDCAAACRTLLETGLA